MCEPRQEYEIFGMVCKSVERDRERDAGDGIAHLQIVLTSRDLAHIAPGRRGIVAEGIIHPFTDLVAESVDVFDGRAENSRVAVGGYCVGLICARNVAVIPKDATGTF